MPSKRIVMIKKVRALIRSYFGFSKAETNGFLVLIPLMVLLLFVPGIYVQLFSGGYDHYEEDKQLLDSLVMAWNANLIEPVGDDARAASRSNEKMVFTLREFNPNDITEPGLRSLGVSQRVARRVLNYRKKGGEFRIKSDFKKIYGLSDSLYRALEPYIQLPDRRTYFSKEKTQTKGLASGGKRDYPGEEKVLSNEIHHGKKQLRININEADTSQLMQLKGIGTVLSRRIIKYKRLLGGYVDIAQLGEVYGVSDSLVVSLGDQLYVEEAFIPGQVNLNIATFKQLNAHPYISYEQTKDILNTKSKFGKFRNAENLHRLSTFSESELDRLIPYLKY